MPTLEFVLPGDPRTCTGGYEYDRRVVAGLRALGWTVRVHPLAASFPWPDPAERAATARVFAALPDGATVVVDGLAFGALPELAAREATRLRLLALVHHPLALEGGLAADAAERLRASERAALAHARGVIVTSAATARQLVDFAVPAARIAVVEPGTEPAPLARGSGGPAVQLLCVATLTPRKGHAQLFEALAPLAHHDWRLDCVGSAAHDPATVARLRQALATPVLGPRVRLYGELEPPALAAAYDRADLFVLAASHEGYGMAAAEALARGLPLVATAVGALPGLAGSAVSDESGVGADATDEGACGVRVARHATGLLVAPDDVVALRAALDRMLGDASLRAQCAAAAVQQRETLPRWSDACARFAQALTALA